MRIAAGGLGSGGWVQIDLILIRALPDAAS